jgi:hypothetical protein
MPFLSDYACKVCLRCLPKISLLEARFLLPPSSCHLGKKTFLSLFLPPSFSLLFLYYNSLFSLPNTFSAPSHALCPLFISTSYPSPIGYHSTLHSYTLTIHRLAYCTTCTQPQPPAIPDTRNLHYNNRNTPKHTQSTKPSNHNTSSPLIHSPFF